METLAILNALLRDLQNLGAGLAWLGLFYLIPAVIVTIVAAARTEPTPWREVLPGLFWGLIVGVLVWMFTLVVSGGLWQRWSPRYHNGVAIGFFFGTLALAMLVQYCVLVIHYYRPLIQQRRQRLKDPQAPPAKRRFAFSLRNILLLQIGLAIAFALWLGIRRNGIMSEYRYRQEQADWKVREASVHARFDAVGWKIHCFQYSPLRLQNPHDTKLTGFTNDVLKQFTPADHLGWLEIRTDALTDEGLEFLSRIEGIEYLELKSARVTDQGIAQLKNLKSLQTLRLDCPLMTEQVLAELQQIESLENVTLYRSQISRERSEAFQDARPGVRLQVYDFPMN